MSEPQPLTVYNNNKTHQTAPSLTNLHVSPTLMDKGIYFLWLHTYSWGHFLETGHNNLDKDKRAGAWRMLDGTLTSVFHLLLSLLLWRLCPTLCSPGKPQLLIPCSFLCNNPFHLILEQLQILLFTPHWWYNPQVDPALNPKADYFFMTRLCLFSPCGRFADWMNWKVWRFGLNNTSHTPTPFFLPSIDLHTGNFKLSLSAENL